MPENAHKPVEVGVVLQGGGALGAYECGALNALLGLMDEFASEHRPITLKVVAAVSIGAVNAVDPGAPNVKFKYAKLHEGQQSREITHEEVGPRVAFVAREGNLLHRLVHASRSVPLKKTPSALSVWAT